MKKLLSTCMILVLISSTNIYAADIPTNKDIEKSNTAIESILKLEKKISLNNAMKLAEIKTLKEPLYTEKLKELKKTEELNIERYGEPTRKVDEKGNVYYKYPSGEPEYNIMQQILDLEEKLKDAIKISRTNARTLYFEISEARQQLAISKSKIEIAKEELENFKRKYSAGIVIKSDVTLKEVNVTTANSNYENMNSNLLNLYNKFEKATDLYKNYEIKIETINFDISSVLKSTSENIVGAYVIPINLDKETENKIKTLADLKNDLEDKETALKKTAEGYDENSVFYYNKSEELGIRALKDQIVGEEIALSINFSGESKKIKNAIDSFQNKKTALELNEKKYDQEVIKFKNGQIKNSDFLKFKLNYEENKQKYDNILKELYVLVDNYNDKYNLEKEE